MYCVIPGKGWAEAAAAALAAEAEGTGGAALSKAMRADLDEIAQAIYMAGTDRDKVEVRYTPTTPGRGPSWQRIDRKPYVEVRYSTDDTGYAERGRVFLGTASTDAGLALARRISAERHLCVQVATRIGEQEARPTQEYQAELGRVWQELDGVERAMRVLRAAVDDMRKIEGGRYSVYAPQGKIEALGRTARKIIDERSRLLRYLRYRSDTPDPYQGVGGEVIVPGCYVYWDAAAAGSGYVEGPYRGRDEVREVLLVDEGSRTAWLGGEFDRGAFGTVQLGKLRPVTADCSVCAERVPGTVRRVGYVAFCPAHADGGPASRPRVIPDAEA